MSIQEIAKLAGVSVATVSRVLNNAESVKQKNREKVLKAIAECNYQPNLLARQLRTAKSSMVLVLVSNIANPFCAEVVKGIEDEADLHGYHILLCNTGSDLERSRSGLQQLPGKFVDGVITTDALAVLPELTGLIGSTPWVQCSEFDEGAGISRVGIDDSAAAGMAVGHLLSLGRHRIALINHDLRYKYSQLREQGYRQTLDGAGADFKAVVYARELSFKAGYAAMTELLDAPERPDAVFAVSDVLAAGAMAAIKAAGLSIPLDIAVAGFDGTELAEIVSPPLTTIRQPADRLGSTAFKLLFDKIENPQSPAERMILECELQVRGSTRQD